MAVQIKAAAILKPKAQQRYVEDSAEASLRAQYRENAELGCKMPFLKRHYWIESK